MKKMLLTGATLCIGLSAAMGQSAHHDFSLPELTDLQKVASSTGEESENSLFPRKPEVELLRLEEVPKAVQAAFTEGRFADYSILSIHAEQAGWIGNGTTYTFELLKATTPTFRMGKDHSLFTSIDEARSETAKADLLLQFNEKGRLLKSIDATEKPAEAEK